MLKLTLFPSLMLDNVSQFATETWAMAEPTAMLKYPIWLGIIYNPGQNIWNKVKKSCKTEENCKKLIPNFGRFLALLSKLNFWREEEALGYVSNQIWHFSNIS